MKGSKRNTTESPKGKQELQKTRRDRRGTEENRRTSSREESNKIAENVIR
jgi:hypothetical protein